MVEPDATITESLSSSSSTARRAMARLASRLILSFTCTSRSATWGLAGRALPCTLYNRPLLSRILISLRMVTFVTPSSLATSVIRTKPRLFRLSRMYLCRSAMLSISLCLFSSYWSKYSYFFAFIKKSVRNRAPVRTLPDRKTRIII